MNVHDNAPRQFVGGELIHGAGVRGPLWRVLVGTVRLLSGPLDAPRIAQIAIAGDLVGVDALCDQPSRFEARALTACRLQPVQAGDAATWQALMREALARQQERALDMAELRIGPVTRRVDRLLEMMRLDKCTVPRRGHVLADPTRQGLPTLRELAQIVDASPETVCRALAQIRAQRCTSGAAARPRGRPGGRQRDTVGLVMSADR
jgi:hypothetical protein